MGNTPLYLASKQINYLLYDHSKQQLIAQFATGKTEAFYPIPKQAYERLLQSDNPYDEFVKLTQKMNILNAPS